MNPIIETRFEYKGFSCVVMFMPFGCHRCGYVGISNNHPLYGKGWRKLEDMIDCHGGVTYCEDHLFGQDDKNTWWIGFDCAHAGDGRDFESGKKYFADDPEKLKEIIKLQELDKKFFPQGELIRTKEYCEEQCRNIVDQLLKAQNK